MTFDYPLQCSTEMAIDNRTSGLNGLTFQFPVQAANEATPDSVATRLARAAEWVRDLDAHYRRLIDEGRNPRIAVSGKPRGGVGGVGRVLHETSSDYRSLRLSVGDLIRPLLLDPPDLKALYPFQRQGVQWLCDRSGGILADDMGLGKTVQVIAAVRLLFNRGEIRSVLVLCPKSLLATWEHEFARWAPELGVAVLTPTAHLREEAWKAVAGGRHVLLANHEQLRNPPQVLQETAPDLIVADEAHRLRNRGSKTTSGVFRLRPSRFWALTGTPLERDSEDLATLLSLIAPRNFAPSDGKLHPASLRGRARPFILRRRKRDVLNELPPVTDTTQALDLSDAQTRAYQAAIREHRQAGEKGMELVLLTRLLRICDLEPESRESCKIEQILFYLERIREQGEKAVVFSLRLEPLRELGQRISRRWGKDAARSLVGEMSREERDDAVAGFRTDSHVFALLASLRVGGEGLTLVEANHVFLFNQWWNPSANDQARDRVVRIGQTRNVRVYRFHCRNTIEEALGRILTTKRELFEATVERLANDESAVWSYILREVGMKQMLTPQKDAGST